jgi:hypothetical protein
MEANPFDLTHVQGLCGHHHGAKTAAEILGRKR